MYYFANNISVQLQSIIKQVLSRQCCCKDTWHRVCKNILYIYQALPSAPINPLFHLYLFANDEVRNIKFTPSATLSCTCNRKVQTFNFQHETVFRKTSQTWDWLPSLSSRSQLTLSSPEGHFTRKFIEENISEAGGHVVWIFLYGQNLKAIFC